MKPNRRKQMATRRKDVEASRAEGTLNYLEETVKKRQRERDQWGSLFDLVSIKISQLPPWVTTLFVLGSMVFGVLYHGWWNLLDEVVLRSSDSACHDHLLHRRCVHCCAGAVPLSACSPAQILSSWDRVQQGRLSTLWAPHMLVSWSPPSVSSSVTSRTR